MGENMKWINGLNIYKNGYKIIVIGDTENKKYKFHCHNIDIQQDFFR